MKKRKLMKTPWKKAASLMLAASMVTGAMSGLNFNGAENVKAADNSAAVMEDTLPSDVQEKLDAYNVVWNTPSSNSSGSMPIGNGDLSANVWVEPDGNLYFYIGKTDSWSEATRLFKIGKVKVDVTPDIFRSGEPFVQMLDLKNGEILVKAGSGENEITLHIWADANHPAIRVEAEGQENFDIKVSRESWRDEPSDVTGQKDSSGTYRGFQDTPLRAPIESADVVVDKEETVEWYHRNEVSPYKDFLEYQHIDEFAEEDPYLNRTFGACIKGEDLEKQDDNTLAGTGKQSYDFSIYAHTDVTDTVEEWEDGLEEKIAADEEDIATAKEEHQEWWDSFWNRSWVFVSGDEKAETVTRGYLLQRYMQAAAGRGAYPIKFNGGTLNFDYKAQNADGRNWGAPYWFQNTRLLYWNMLASGDFEMMQPFFNLYKNALNMQKNITKKYYGHDGAFFPETINLFGAYVLTDFLDKNPSNDGVDPKNPYMQYYWQGGLEMAAMMLEYYDYTKDETFLKETAIPFAEEIVKFYSEHYERENGVLKITPAHALETFWEGVVNPAEVVAGMQVVVNGLLKLSDEQITADQRAEWTQLQKELPAVPTGTSGDETFIKPAEEYSPKRHNGENPELYPVFPYKLYGVGKDDLETGINTFERRGEKGEYCWHQDGIQAAYLGLTEDAKRAVISHFSQKDSGIRFPAFWPKGNDWVPDLDNGGSAMSALQAMILQCDEEKIQVLPTWPAEWSVDAKLNALDNTAVRVQYQAGGQVKVNTNPESRMEDVIVNRPELSHPVPGVLEAENYLDMSGIEVEECTEGGEAVTSIDRNDWMEYKVDVAVDGEYKVVFRTAVEEGKTADFDVLLDGKLVKVAKFEATDGIWNDFQQNMKLAKGEHKIRLLSRADGWKLNWMKFENAPSTIGKIEAENYTDKYGDVKKDGLGLGYISVGDWMEYKVNIPHPGAYKMVYRVAVNKTPGKINVSANGTALGQVEFPGTGGWNNWSNVSQTVKFEEAGEQTIRMNVLASGWNFDYFTLAEAMEPADVDKTELEALYEEYSNLEQGEYTDASWAVFTEAFDMVRNTLADENASQETVDAAVAAIKNAVANLEENQDDMDGVFTITVDGKATEHKYNDAVTIEAPAEKDGKKFSCWMAGDEIVSYETVYKFYVSKSMKFTAVYADETVEAEPKAMLTNVFVTKRADEKSDVKFVGELVITEGYELVNAGLVWSSKEGTKLVLGGELKPTYITKISDTNQFSVTIKGMPQGRFIRGRIFATISNGTETKVIYSAEKKAEAK